MKKKIKSIEYNPVNDPKRMHGYEGVRWVENASLGLRLVGFADEIARKEGRRGIDHHGWFTDDMQSETYRGIVYQLPARGGRLAQYVYGYADPNNDDCALLCFGDVQNEALEAAKQADRFAEIFADDAREYNRAWQAGQRYRELDDEIKDMRKTALAIGEEMRAARKVKMTAITTICATLRKEIMSLYRRIQKARKKRRELMRDFGRSEDFTE